MNKQEAKYNEFLNIIERWACKGERTTSLGARLICPAPHIASEAWFHVLYSGLRNEDQLKLQNKISLPIPNELLHFLSHTNGADLFGNAIHLWGLRYSYERKGDEAWQPFDMELHNRRSERPLDRPPYILMFGSCDKGESRLFFDTRDGVESSRIGKTARAHFAPSQYWSDFWSWLLEETNQLTLLYDEYSKSIR